MIMRITRCLDRAALNDGVITEAEIKDAVKIALEDKFLSVAEQKEFLAAIEKHKGKLTAKALSEAKAHAAPVAVTLKGARFTNESKDADMTSETLTLAGVDKYKSRFTITLTREKEYDESGTKFTYTKWTGVIDVTHENGRQSPARPLTDWELASLGGQTGVGRWFAGAPSVDQVADAQSKIEKADPGFTFGPNMDMNDLPDTWKGRKLLQYKAIDFDAFTKGGMMVTLRERAGSPDQEYAYWLLFKGGKVYSIRDDVGGAKAAEL